MSGMLRMLLRRIVRRGTLEVRVGNAPPFQVGDGDGTPLTLIIEGRKAARRLALNPELTLGELYMDGQLRVEGDDIADLLALFLSNMSTANPPAPIRALRAARTAIRRCRQHNGPGRARRNVAHHYDLDGRLYDLFLDNDRQYSCAYFERPRASLDAAQLAKKRHIAAKLIVEPGQKVLDIGCGWGGLGLYLAEQCGADVTGITLSTEQLGVARERARAKGLDAKGLDGRGAHGHVDFRLEDYRATQGTFDRVVSVGMFEHVGAGYYPTFFKHVARLLAPKGVMLLHFIGRVTSPGATNPWIDKYIFPGGYVPALSEVMAAIEPTGLIVTDVEVLRLHYAETLRHWRARFHAHRAESLALFDERFFRMWDFYLAASEMSFRHDGLVVFQLQIAHDQEAVPLTRDYIGDREDELRRRDAQTRDLRLAGE
jgi:cyclopropane-fatty-acyl-phospholipid synthase